VQSENTSDDTYTFSLSRGGRTPRRVDRVYQTEVCNERRSRVSSSGPPTRISACAPRSKITHDLSVAKHHPPKHTPQTQRVTTTKSGRSSRITAPELPARAATPYTRLTASKSRMGLAAQTHLNVLSKANSNRSNCRQEGRMSAEPGYPISGPSFPQVSANSRTVLCSPLHAHQEKPPRTRILDEQGIFWQEEVKW